MTFVPLHHLQKSTRLSPFLLFVIVVWGERMPSWNWGGLSSRWNCLFNLSGLASSGCWCLRGHPRQQRGGAEARYLDAKLSTMERR